MFKVFMTSQDGDYYERYPVFKHSHSSNFGLVKKVFKEKEEK